MRLSILSYIYEPFVSPLWNACSYHCPFFYWTISFSCQSVRILDKFWLPILCQLHGLQIPFPSLWLGFLLMVSASLAKGSKIPIISNRTHQHFGKKGKAILDSYADTARKTGSPFSHTGWSTVSRKTTKPFYRRTQRVCLGPAHISNVFLQTMGHLCIFRLGDNKQDLRKVQRKDRSESWGPTQCTGVPFSQQCQR